MQSEQKKKAKKAPFSEYISHLFDQNKFFTHTPL